MSAEQEIVGASVADGALVSEAVELPSLERFDPRQGAGKLIDSEHRGRYWWAAQAVAGKEVLDAGCGVGYGLQILADAGASSVTGADIDEDAVEEARRRYGDAAEEIAIADLRQLPFPDDSFDLAVCFETIEHVEDGERALAELRRVLRRDGVLLISSPNPDVYPGGNEHHFHEYRPAELAAVLGERFSNVASYRQHPWLASLIEPVGATAPAAARHETRATSRIEPDGETYSIHVASDADLPALDGLLVLGADFEARWWAEQVDTARQESTRARQDATSAIEAAKAETREQIQAAEDRARQHIAAAESQARAHIETTEREAARNVALAEQREAEARTYVEAAEREAARNVAVAEQREAEARARLHETSAALLEANQSLAEVPALRHRFEELQAQTDGLHAHIATLEGSKSWRYMAPLRRLRSVFRRRNGNTE